MDMVRKNTGRAVIKLKTQIKLQTQVVLCNRTGFLRDNYTYNSQKLAYIKREKDIYCANYSSRNAFI